jgi:hypothetical protein
MEILVKKNLKFFFKNDRMAKVIIRALWGINKLRLLLEPYRV